MESPQLRGTSGEDLERKARPVRGTPKTGLYFGGKQVTVKDDYNQVLYAVSWLCKSKSISFSLFIWRVISSCFSTLFSDNDFRPFFL